MSNTELPDASPRSEPFSGTARMLVGAGLVLALGGGLALWARYGASVFYEIIVSGLVACF